eukprot:TRINITY_DN34015_c0_g1_i1.p1 TRINITY_DN34015_c0_g1~~TRINITY_DN34015_c0_g1_i1.p1  ORF type:complete len:250 (+),score=39.62 TRINITY_DN34015_c0_g1_i1:95-844(+)
MFNCMAAITGSGPSSPSPEARTLEKVPEGGVQWQSPLASQAGAGYRSVNGSGGLRSLATNTQPWDRDDARNLSTSDRPPPEERQRHLPQRDSPGSSYRSLPSTTRLDDVEEAHSPARHTALNGSDGGLRATDWPPPKVQGPPSVDNLSSSGGWFENIQAIRSSVIDDQPQSEASMRAQAGYDALESLLAAIEAQTVAFQSDANIVRRHYAAAQQIVSKVRFEALAAPKNGRAVEHRKSSPGKVPSSPHS